MSLSAGTRLGPYEVIGRLGAGGMGEVYRAHDRRLNREVAIKVLPEDFLNDEPRRKRFEKEARAVAALNHPNIVAIYDAGENFLVSELVDGQTLRVAGKLTPRQAIDLATQIAEGLAAAHAAGFAHRDLKPENLMVTRDGRAKILDFGLAKITQPPANGTEAPTATETGMIVGTVGYMSPEQVKGLPADHRSDIFSFGLVLYEMLTGRRAFAGSSKIEVLNAILKEDPPELPDSIAPALRRIVEHCLNKNPDRRFQSALDLAFALQTPHSIGPLAMPEPPSRFRRLGLTAAGVLVIAVSIGAPRLLWRAPEPQQWFGTILGGPGMALNPRISPDGHLLAFQAIDRGLTQVAVMKPESGNWSILTHRRDLGVVWQVSWSPDGALIYYDRQTDVLHGIFSVPLLGGEERLLLTSAGYPESLPDGSLLVVRSNSERRLQYYRFWPETGRLQEVPLFTTSLTHRSARALAGGKDVIVFGTPLGTGALRPGLFAVDLATNGLRRVTPRNYDDEAIMTFATSRDGKSILATKP